jgi:hypothetical protein
MLARVSNNELVGVNVGTISPAMSLAKILRGGNQGTRKELMSKTKALSAHFPNTPRRQVRAWVPCDHDVRVSTPAKTKCRRYRCRKPFDIPWNYPRRTSVSPFGVEIRKSEGRQSFQIRLCRSGIAPKGPRSRPILFRHSAFISKTFSGGSIPSLHYIPLTPGVTSLAFFNCVC